MHSNADIARALAAAFLAGSLDVDELVDRGARLFGKPWRWLRPVALRTCAAFEGRPRPRQIAVAEFLLADDGFVRACEKFDLTLIDHLTAPPKMIPVAAASTWRLPAIRTPRELADWLGITLGDLEWFADLRCLEYKRNQGRLRHYRYRPLTKPGGQVRLVEAPKPRLKALQRRILVDLLDHIPSHAAVHGFRRGRSIKTFASPHVGQRVVLRLDLRNFFPSIPLARIQALFRTVGYPECVADSLAGLCTNATPLDVWDDGTVESAGRAACNARGLYSRRHVPQGAPTSPALSNLCAYRMDCRLSRLASAVGAAYTRYADDLAFSGDREFERAVQRFALHVCATVMQEGFAVHHRKTRIMRQGVRQRLAGIVVNERLNVIRADYDRLKATLTNCIRFGAETQNRSNRQDFRAHLLGRVSAVAMVNSTRGQQLYDLFEQIKW